MANVSGKGPTNITLRLCQIFCWDYVAVDCDQFSEFLSKGWRTNETEGHEGLLSCYMCTFWKLSTLCVTPFYLPLLRIAALTKHSSQGASDNPWIQNVTSSQEIKSVPPLCDGCPLNVYPCLPNIRKCRPMSKEIMSSNYASLTRILYVANINGKCQWQMSEMMSKRLWRLYHCTLLSGLGIFRSKGGIQMIIVKADARGQLLGQIFGSLPRRKILRKYPFPVVKGFTRCTWLGDFSFN